MFLIENGTLKAYSRECDETDVVIPEGVTTIDKEVFKDVPYIRSVTIPEGVTTIGEGAFYDCLSLTTITLPETVSHIGEDAFYGCSSLTSINTLGQITEISKRTFYDCFSLKSITIPQTVTSIGERAFNGCRELASINLPRGLTHIGECAFYVCSKIASLKLPDCLEVIGEYAFSDCLNLKDINIPPYVREIGAGAFQDCKITSITIPKTIDSIPNVLFNHCESLERIEFPNNITSIGYSAFQSCYSLREVSIPQSIKIIGKSAFGWCKHLRRVTFLGEDTEIQLNAFIDCTDLVTNLPIRQWKSDYGSFKLSYAMYYMRQYTPGDPFFENVKEENKAYIKGQLKKLLKKYSQETDSYSNCNSPDISGGDTNMVIFLTQEKLLRIDEVDLLLEKILGNPEASALLLDYRARNFSEEFLKKYETDKLNKELGLKEHTVTEWKQIYRLGDDGNGGYKITGYKGKDLNVEIPEKIGKKLVTAIDDYAFSAEALHITHEIRNIRSLLETVIIPDSVTSIGNKVFSFCKSLNCIVYRGKTFTPDEFEECCHPKKPDQK